MPATWQPGVGQAFHRWPGLEQALASGVLGWTKVRLLASVPHGEAEEEWIARAKRLTAERLSKMVRAIDRGAVDAEGTEEEEPRSRVCEVRCSPAVRLQWHHARSAASRVAGRMVPISEAAELIAAEVLSAIPLDVGANDEAGDDDPCDTAEVSRTTRVTVSAWTPPAPVRSSAWSAPPRPVRLSPTPIARAH